MGKRRERRRAARRRMGLAVGRGVRMAEVFEGDWVVDLMVGKFGEGARVLVGMEPLPCSGAGGSEAAEPASVEKIDVAVERLRQ